jgi:quinoprotein glucose dehydrogenase
MEEHRQHELRAPMSGDESLGTVYMGFAGGSNIYYGGDRPGTTCSESLVCPTREPENVSGISRSAATESDYDIPAAPNLIDVTVGGKRVRASRRSRSRGFCSSPDRQWAC